MDHYLDNSATTKTCPEAIEAAIEVMKGFYGNPSSTHKVGREAAKKLANCRQMVADALGAKPTEVVFTSCGSEGDNWAIIKGAESMRRQGCHIISSMVEHDAVRESLDLLEKEGFEVTRLRPDNCGVIHEEAVLAALRPDTVLVTLMLVNNETGAVTDIAGISKALRKAGYKGLIHTDAVQGFMKVLFKAKTLGADLITVSGHKIHAVKGIGALYIRDGLKLPNFLIGGHQENGRRAGTEALPQIAAFAAACAMDPKIEDMRAMKSWLVKALRERIPEVRILDTEAPHILSISMPGWRSEVLMNHLETYEVYVSKSSACKQGRRSHVLEALGMAPEVIDGTIRIGLCRYNSQEDLEALVAGLETARKLAHR